MQDTSITRKRLIIVSIVYIVVALIAGTVAVSQNLAAQPLGEGSGTGRPVLQEFLFGNGTAMSPGLPWLALQAILTWLVSRQGRWGNYGVIGLAVFGLLSGVFALTEPMARKIFSPENFDPVKAALEAGIIVIPFVMMVLAILVLLGKRRQGAAAS